MNIFALNEGKFNFDNNKKITYLDDSVNQLGLKISVCPFLIECGEDVVLLDAGLGWKEDGIPVIHTNICKAGFQPEDVTIILLSHLHKDHISGLVDGSSDNWQFNFPDAKIYIQKREFEFMKSKQGSASYDFEILQFIVENAQINWLDDDQGNITNEISYEVSGGHTAYHQVFHIQGDGKTAFYGGDNLPTMSYLKYRTAFKTDSDGRKALNDRIEWEEKAKQENWTVLFYHDLDNNIVEF